MPWACGYFAPVEEQWWASELTVGTGSTSLAEEGWKVEVAARSRKPGTWREMWEGIFNVMS